MAGPSEDARRDADAFAGLANALGRAPRVAVLSAPYYADVAGLLMAGARAELELASANIETIEVPGALELPQALEVLLGGSAGHAVDGVVAIGCVIRGETSHYDIVCNNANHWMMDVALRYRVPLGNALLTVDTHAQAIARAEGGRRGKGGDAARAVLSLIALDLQLEDRHGDDADSGFTV